MGTERFAGWIFGDSPRDRAILALYRQYREKKLNFADWVKDLIYQYINGELVEASQHPETLAMVSRQLDQIKKMLESGMLTYNKSPESTVDDAELLDILGGMST